MSSAHAYQAQQVTGEFQPMGVYTNLADSDYVAPADSSLIYWDAETQSANREIDFSLVNPGQIVLIRVINTNGFLVESSDGSFSLESGVQRGVLIVAVDGSGSVAVPLGDASQYNIGTSGFTLGLLNANWAHSGNYQQTGNTTFSKVENGTTNGISIQQLVFNSYAIMRWITTTKSWQFGAGGAGSAFPDCWYIYDEVAMGARIIVGPTGNIAIGGVVPSSGAKLEVQGSSQLGPTASSTVFGGKRLGLATMAAGTTGAIADTTITAGSTITLSPGFAPAGTLYYTKTAGVGFTILSTNAADAGEVSWERTIL